MKYRPAIRLVLLLALCWAGLARATVWVALSDNSDQYTEAAEAVRANFQQFGGSQVVVKSWQEAVTAPSAGATVVISLGSGAYTGLMDAAAAGRWGRTPIVAALLPRAVYDQQRLRAFVPGSAVLLDQPLARQMALMRYAFPSASRIGVLLGSESGQLEANLAKAANDQGLVVNVYRVDNEMPVNTALQRLLDENDVLLAVPDPLVFNSSSVQNILLATYRNRVPLVGFSPAYVRAGATVGLYSTPTQVGTQAARLARSVLLGQASYPAQMPGDFQVGVNANVSRSLGFRLSEELLRLELLRREGL